MTLTNQSILEALREIQAPGGQQSLVQSGAIRDLVIDGSTVRLVLAVEDNGPGVLPRERTRIFEQFYRVDDLLTREVEGTGLGLSIARSIVRAHGGRIRVEDGEESGSRFVVELPRAGGGASSPAATAKEVRA